ncbi:MAG: diphosphate--fructose-6-phosphate 1-phosphotransferase [Armatimonadetes bacterium]|jgi:6-phosphofructokinase 1|nr:diphosphate--fructose-6-phosphate 1-phosphotransferase [Armatimonadota bacterium]
METPLTSIKVLGNCRLDTPIAPHLGDHALFCVGAADRIPVDHRLSAIQERAGAGEAIPTFELAGPRNRIYFDPSKTRCGIVTCGGLCPGVNNVIQGLVRELLLGYGVRSVTGFRCGYQGFIARYRHPVVDLTLDNVEGIQEQGGTMLSSSRGEQDPEEVVDCLERQGIQILFVIGGDGTMRGALEIVNEIERRGSRIAVVGIPKTIDNDLMYIDKSFGFDTAYSKAVEFIRGAHVEAKGAPHGVGLVKVMGRHSGFIACHAALASQDANFVLIPEVPFTIDGLWSVLRRRLEHRGHAVIVAAEGAGQELLKADPTAAETDASGNATLGDVGCYLRRELCAAAARDRFEMSLKYLDPSYAIRSVPASPPDAIFCHGLARGAVHAAMAGNTAMMVSLWHGQFVHVPMSVAVSGRKQVDPLGYTWISVLESTGQPPVIGDLSHDRIPSAWSYGAGGRTAMAS